ncbi:MAG: hypothetical protein ACFHWX_09775 [Bacteroidota bacterium]
MKKLWTPFILIVIISACAPTKNIDNAVGSWDFLLKGTPNGDVNGYFTIAKEGDSYAGTIYSNQGSNPLKNITIEDDVINCNFNYQSYDIKMQGTFSGNSFTGKMSVDYNDFPLTATKRE